MKTETASLKVFFILILFVLTCVAFAISSSASVDEGNIKGISNTTSSYPVSLALDGNSQGGDEATPSNTPQRPSTESTVDDDEPENPVSFPPTSYPASENELVANTTSSATTEEPEPQYEASSGFNSITVWDQPIYGALDVIDLSTGNSIVAPNTVASNSALDVRLIWRNSPGNSGIDSILADLTIDMTQDRDWSSWDWVFSIRANDLYGYRSTQLFGLYDLPGVNSSLNSAYILRPNTYNNISICSVRSILLINCPIGRNVDTTDPNVSAVTIGGTNYFKIDNTSEEIFTSYIDGSTIVNFNSATNISLDVDMFFIDNYSFSVDPTITDLLERITVSLMADASHGLTHPVAELRYVYFQQTNLDWSNLSAEYTSVNNERRLLISGLSSVDGTTNPVNGASTSIRVFIPAFEYNNSLYVCPDATSLSDIQIGCSNGYEDTNFSVLNTNDGSVVYDTLPQGGYLLASGTYHVQNFNTSSDAKPYAFDSSEYVLLEDDGIAEGYYSDLFTRIYTIDFNNYPGIELTSVPFPDFTQDQDWSSVVFDYEVDDANNTSKLLARNFENVNPYGSYNITIPLPDDYGGQNLLYCPDALTLDEIGLDCPNGVEVSSDFNKIRRNLYDMNRNTIGDAPVYFDFGATQSGGWYAYEAEIPEDANLLYATGPWLGPIINIFEKETGEVWRDYNLTYPGSTSSLDALTGIAVNPLTCEMYGTAIMDSYTYFDFVSVNTDNFSLSNIKTEIGGFASLEFDGEGNLYGLTGNGTSNYNNYIKEETLFRIDTETGDITELIEFGYGDFGGTISYNPNDGYMYYLSGAQDSAETANFIQIDLDTLNTTSIPVTTSASYGAPMGFDYDESINGFYFYDWYDDMYTIDMDGNVTYAYNSAIWGRDYAEYGCEAPQQDDTDNGGENDGSVSGETDPPVITFPSSPTPIIEDLLDEIEIISVEPEATTAEICWVHQSDANTTFEIGLDGLFETVDSKISLNDATECIQLTDLSQNTEYDFRISMIHKQKSEIREAEGTFITDVDNNKPVSYPDDIGSEPENEAGSDSDDVSATNDIGTPADTGETLGNSTIVLQAVSVITATTLVAINIGVGTALGGSNILALTGILLPFARNKGLKIVDKKTGNPISLVNVGIEQEGSESTINTITSFSGRMVMLTNLRQDRETSIHVNGYQTLTVSDITEKNAVHLERSKGYSNNLVTGLVLYQRYVISSLILVGVIALVIAGFAVSLVAFINTFEPINLIFILIYLVLFATQLDWHKARYQRG